MAKIAFYSDSFGWGHATRDIEFLRRWASDHPESKVYWRVERKKIGFYEFTKEKINQFL